MKYSTPKWPLWAINLTVNAPNEHWKVQKFQCEWEKSEHFPWVFQEHFTILHGNTYFISEKLRGGDMLLN